MARYPLAFGFLLLLSVLAVPPAAVAEPPALGDYDGDGFADLAVGVPYEAIRNRENAGVVHVIYGSQNGLGSAGNQLFRQGGGGLLETAESNDQFGASVAWGDFDDDGYDDLAIGAPGEVIGGNSVGAIHVIYGSAGGLVTAGQQHFLGSAEQCSGARGGLESPPALGASMAAGNFGYTPEDDLAVGAPGRNYEAGETCNLNVGFVNLFRGSPDGLVFLNSLGIGITEDAGRFGSSLAIGNVGKNAYEDVVGGAPGHNVGNVGDAGVVYVLYGSETGLSLTSQDAVHQDAFEGSAAEEGDGFGISLAIGNFGGTQHADLAIGTPLENSGATVFTGQVNVAFGSPTGITTAGGQTLRKVDLSGVPPAEGDFFGRALAAAQFGGSSRADLAIGAPGEQVGADIMAGAVHVAFGSADGLTVDGAQLWTQDHPAIEGAADVNDQFGAALTAGTYGRSSHADLAIGVPREDTPITDGGAVHVLYGGNGGLRTTGSQFWTQDSGSIRDGVEPDDFFGTTLG